MRNSRRIIKSLAQSVTGRRDLANYLRTRKEAFKKRIYRAPISVGEFRSGLNRLGVSRGRAIWLQSSWNQFYNLPLKPREVLEILIETLGPDGTLVMPAFPLNPDPTKVLMIDAVPSSTGLLTEVFRRWPGVSRSIHFANSVCALGPQAEYLVRDHHRTPLSFGKDTPFCRLLDIDARFVCLGVGPFVHNLAPLHSVECLLYDEVPYFKLIMNEKMKYRWKRANGEAGDHEIYLRNARIDATRYGRNFDPTSYVDFRLSNLTAFSIEGRVAISTALELARRGITIYTDPKPQPEMFMKVAK
jgi:aminoglycoside N3'-acetyltransferase